MHLFLSHPVVRSVVAASVGLVDDFPLLDDIAIHLTANDLNAVHANPLSSGIYDVEHHSSMRLLRIRMLCITEFH